MKIKSQRDFWSGLLFVVIGIAFAWRTSDESFGVGFRVVYLPEPTTLALLLLGGLAVVRLPRCHVAK